MFSQLTLHVLLALSAASAVVALPAAAPKTTQVLNKNGIKIPFVRHQNFTGVNLLKSDQARAKALRERHLSKGSSFNKKAALSAASQIGVDITNTAVTYVAEVRRRVLGTPDLENADRPRSGPSWYAAADVQLDRRYRKLEYLGRRWHCLRANQRCRHRR